MAQTKPPFFKSKIFIALATLIFAAILIVALLPQLSSTDFVSTRLKTIINDNAPGSVDYEQLQLSWLGGVQIQQLRYNDDSMGVKLAVDSIMTSKGLLSLAMNYRDGGTIEINRPVLRIMAQEEVTTPAPATSQPKAAQPTERKTSQPVQAPDKSKPATLPTLPPMSDTTINM